MNENVTNGMNEKEPVIRTVKLFKNYGGKTAIDSFTINIPEGGLIGLVGRNGSGKTTLMKMCAGRLDVTGGVLEVFGRAPMDNLAVLSDLVYINHDTKYDGYLKLSDVLRNYVLMFPNFDLEFAGSLLKYFNLQPNLKFRELSLGMTSIFNFICGLSCRSKLTMFDEPIIGMDAAARKDVNKILLRDYNEHPRTIIVSSHLLTEVENLLSDIMLINEGRLVLFRNIDDLRQSAYSVEGEKEAVNAFCSGRNTLFVKSGMSGEAVIMERFDDEVAANAKQSGLRVSAVKPEDLCVYLTGEDREGELECLLQKTN